MPTHRFGLSLQVMRGTLYAIGGFGSRKCKALDGPGQSSSQNCSGLATVEAFDGTSGAWTHAPPMPTKRFGLTAAVLNGLIYVVGGCSVDVTKKTKVPISNRVDVFDGQNCIVVGTELSLANAREEARSQNLFIPAS